MHSSRSSHKDFLKSQSLTRRRRKRKIVRLWVMFFTVCAVIALVVWIISLPSMAIKKVIVAGNANITSEEIQRITDSILDDTYIGLFSKRNALIYPKKKIEQVLTTLYPRIDKVGIDTESFEILNIKIKERQADAVWCAAIQCYLVDENGYIFAEYNEARKGDSLVGALDSIDAEGSNSDSAASISTSTKVVANTVGDLSNLTKLYGGDQLIGPEPVGKSIFNKKLYLDIQHSVVELKKIAINIDSVHVFSRDEIVFDVETGGKLIFSDRKPFEDSLDDLKASLNSSVFVGTSSLNTARNSTASSSQLKIVLPAHFEYIDVRFGNKVFYKINKVLDEKGKASSTIKN